MGDLIRDVLVLCVKWQCVSFLSVVQTMYVTFLFLRRRGERQHMIAGVKSCEITSYWRNGVMYQGNCCKAKGTLLH